MFEDMEGVSRAVTRRTDNTMTKRKRQKDRQYNGQKKKTVGQTTQWPKEKDRTENTMAKRKRQKDR